MKNSRFLFLLFLFFCSGFPAILYQLVWQRTLFTIFGVNIESITVVVAAFMLGLGSGSLLGGRLTKIQNISPLLTFAILEFGIALFGYFSLPLFEFAAMQTSSLSPLTTFAVSFLLVLFPTLMMGATLPILTSHFVAQSGKVGKSIGQLYFVNTIGSAAACFVAGIWLFKFLGMANTIHLSVSINLAIAVFITIAFFSRRPCHSIHTESERPKTAPSIWNRTFIFACAVSALVGFTSLGFEILWARIYSYTSGGAAYSFSFMLGFFLTGIAIGSLYSGRLSQKLSGQNSSRSITQLGLILLLANLVSFSVIPTLSFMVSELTWVTVKDSRWVLSLPLIAVASALYGVTMPILGHVSIPADNLAGYRLSYLYLSNILGATLGSLGTGFIVLEYLTSAQTSYFLTSVGLCTALMLVLHSSRHLSYFQIGKWAFPILVITLLYPIAFQHPMERMLFKKTANTFTPFNSVSENRHGIITVTDDGKVFGGGVYDGQFNTDPIRDTNAISRAYMLSGFHSTPKDVLMIGLSTGSWAQVIANHPNVASLTIIEINPGYRKLIEGYTPVKSLLDNPKVTIEIDDGRRWLRNNPLKKFDLIVSNTTFHHRAYISNLLSNEFLRLIKTHLNPKGLYYFNTTGSKRAAKTALTVFEFGYLVSKQGMKSKMVVAGKQPFSFAQERFLHHLEHYRIDEKLVYPSGILDTKKALEKQYSGLIELPSGIPNTTTTFEITDKAEILKDTEVLQYITDDNMGHEWDSGYRLFQRYLINLLQ